MLDEKAQLHTLEGVTASVIILLVIIYAIDATSLTPLTSSTANVHVEAELHALGQDILNSLDYAEPGYNSKLKDDIATWNGSEYVWNGTDYKEKGNATGQNNLTNNLTEVLSDTLVRRGITHDVELTFLADNGTSYSLKMIYNGDPSNNAVIVSRKIVLHDGDIKSEGNPIMDIDPSTNLYNIVDVKLILWRM